MKLKFTILFLFLALNCWSQSFAELKQQVAKVYEASYVMDFQTILDYTYPKLFQIVDREIMYENLEKTFQNDDFSIRLVNSNPKFNYSEIKTIGQQKFCIITYNNLMRMKFEQKLTDEIVTAMLISFQENMKEKKVTFEKDRNSFLFEGKDTLIAISDNSTKKQWKFITYDESQKSIVSKIITENARRELGLLNSYKP